MEYTRRKVMAVGAATIATGLAGCSESESGGDGTDTAGTESNGSGSYSVSMAPVGEVQFDAPPESVAHYFPDYADMAVALGKASTINSIGMPSRYHTTHYDALEGVSVDTESVTKLIGESGIPKEIFFELDSDLHMIDPQWLISNDAFKLESSDIEDITERIAPFLGNAIFRRTDKWHDYEYYTLYDAFEKVASVYQESERFEQLKTFHDDYVGEIESQLPEERPNALLCWQGEDKPESFSPYRLGGEGTNKKAFHDIGLTDALEGSDVEGLSESSRGTIDYETLAQVDPDSILVRGHEAKTQEEFQNTVVAFMKEHPVASKLTAVQDDTVFRGGPIYPGPLHHLFLVERYATSYYPDTFSGELFDRSELASIITG